MVSLVESSINDVQNIATYVRDTTRSLSVASIEVVRTASIRINGREERDSYDYHHDFYLFYYNFSNIFMNIQRVKEMESFKSALESTLFKIQTKLDVVSRLFYIIRDVPELNSIEYRNILIMKDYLKVISVINEDLDIMKKTDRKFHLVADLIFDKFLKDSTFSKISKISISRFCYLYFYKFDIISPIVSNSLRNIILLALENAIIS